MASHIHMLNARSPAEKSLSDIASHLCWRKLHQGERRPAVWAIWIAERFSHLKVMVVGRFDELHGLARGFDRCGEVATLPLEVWRLEGAIGDDDWRIELIDMAL